MPIANEHTLKIDEGERQMVLLALAELALSRPGFDDILSRIAQRIDNPGLQLYSDFKLIHADRVRAERGPMMPMIAEQEEADVQRWIWGVANSSPTEAGDFLQAFVKAVLRADHQNYPLLRPAVIALKAKFPKYNWELEELKEEPRK